MRLYQTKTLLHGKGNYQQNEKASIMEWIKIFANQISEKGLIYKVFIT